MFIVFEGTDGSGKTTLSKLVAGKLDFPWTKEPTFSSEKADELNLKSMDTSHREVEFAMDRVFHKELGLMDLVCDRYIWSGFAYCNVFNPSNLEFIKAFYGHKFFRKPDIHVFVNTPAEVCVSRGRAQSIDMIERLKDAFFQTSGAFSSTPVIEVKGCGSIKATVDHIIARIRPYMDDGAFIKEATKRYYEWFKYRTL